MKNNPPKRVLLPLWQSLAWIIASVFFITGPSYLGFRWYLQKRNHMRSDPKFLIRWVMQTGPQRQALSTECLAEILQLSSNQQIRFHTFDIKQAQKLLNNCPVIASSSVKTIEPDTVFVDYTVRQPIAFLEDFQNVAIDKEGYPFPFSPFFSPKNLPFLYLGLNSHLDDAPPFQWNTSLSGKYFDLAHEVLQIVSAPDHRHLFNVQRIDVSNAFAESYGTREIVLITEDLFIQGQTHYFFPRILRLSTKNYPQELGNYLKWREQWFAQEGKNLPSLGLEKSEVRSKEKIIDLRIEQLAFVDG